MYRAAKLLGRDPLCALGVPSDPGAPLTPEQAMFVLRMENPEAAREQDGEMEARSIAQRFERDEAWEDALPGGRGYRGKRGA